jgi:hypothetical protein
MYNWPCICTEVKLVSLWLSLVGVRAGKGGLRQGVGTGPCSIIPLCFCTYRLLFVNSRTEESVLLGQCSYGFKACWF